MAFAQELIATLKKELRANRVTYVEVSKHLRLSESSVRGNNIMASLMGAITRR